MENNTYIGSKYQEIFFEKIFKNFALQDGADIANI